MQKQKITRILKKHFGQYAKDNAFQLYQGDSLVRISDKILQGIYFQPSVHSDKMNLSVFIQPLFIPADRVSLSFGKRWGEILERGDYWIDLQESNIENEVNEVKWFINKYAMHWFNLTRSSREVLENCERKADITFPTEGWNRLYVLGYCACDCQEYAKAKKYLGEALSIHNEELKFLKNPQDTLLRRKTELEELLTNLDNPNIIREILDNNVERTCNALRINFRVDEPNTK